MNGTQITGIQNFTLPPYACQICGVGDFNGDGLADLVTSIVPDGEFFLLAKTRLATVHAANLVRCSGSSGWLPVGPARLNGPGAAPALIWRNANTGAISPWFMTSFVRSSVGSFGTPVGNAVLEGSGDFFGDGNTDLLLFDTFTKLVGYWQMNGAQAPVPISLAPVARTWVPVGAENLASAGNALASERIKLITFNPITSGQLGVATAIQRIHSLTKMPSLSNQSH